MIYAVLGVHLFADAPNQDGHFDSFFQSLFTMFQVSFALILGLFWAHNGSLLHTYWVSFAPTLGLFWAHTGSLLGPYRVSFGHTLGLFWAHTGSRLGVCWGYIYNCISIYHCIARRYFFGTYTQRILCTQASTGDSWATSFYNSIFSVIFFEPK